MYLQSRITGLCSRNESFIMMLYLPLGSSFSADFPFTLEIDPCLTPVHTYAGSTYHALHRTPNYSPLYCISCFHASENAMMQPQVSRDLIYLPGV